MASTSSSPNRTSNHEESEMETELKRALEEACGITISSALYPTALLLFGDSNDVPSFKLARWLASARRHYQNSYGCVGALPESLLGVPLLPSEPASIGALTISSIPIPYKEADQTKTLWDRLKNTAELDINSGEPFWHLVESFHLAEHSVRSKSIEDDNLKQQEVTVNSGGVVYFALFKNTQEHDVNAQEATAVMKFTSSRLITQSERLGYELAKELGVSTPQSRVIHKGTHEWSQIHDAVERCLSSVKTTHNEGMELLYAELLEALNLNRCLLLMGYINGFPLLETAEAFQSQEAAERTAAELGKILVLDLILRNEDRLACHQLGWRGNPANLLATKVLPLSLKNNTSLLNRQQLHSEFPFGKASRSRKRVMVARKKGFHSAQSLSTLKSSDTLEQGSGWHMDASLPGSKTETPTEKVHIVAIDSGVPRRPPNVKRINDQLQYPKLVELARNDPLFAADLLYEISSGKLGIPISAETSKPKAGQLSSFEEIDQEKVTNAFQAGFRNAIREMQGAHGFLLNLYRKLDMLLRDFVLAVSSKMPNDEAKLGTDAEESSDHHTEFCCLSPLRAKSTAVEALTKTGGSPRADVRHNEHSSINENSVTSDDREVPLRRLSGSNEHAPLGKRLTLKSKMPNDEAKLGADAEESSDHHTEFCCLSPSIAKSAAVEALTKTGSSPKIDVRHNEHSSINENSVTMDDREVPLRRLSGSNEHTPLGKRLTLKLKTFSKTAKVNVELNEELQHWNTVLSQEGRMLCEAKGFVTGFLEGGGCHSVVDSYELKIRLEHMLERMACISKAADTERPSCVTEHLYIGGALAAGSLHTLKNICISHVLCLCPKEMQPPEEDYLKMFQYRDIQIEDIEGADIVSIFKVACDFIQSAEERNGKVLVHCFEGKSRSATVVLAYLMIRKNETLEKAWNHLKKVHPRAHPNDGFMRALVDLDKQIHGVNSVNWQQTKPALLICPACGKGAGISSSALRYHLLRWHPGTDFTIASHRGSTLLYSESPL